MPWSRSVQAALGRWTLGLALGIALLGMGDRASAARTRPSAIGVHVLASAQPGGDRPSDGRRQFVWAAGALLGLLGLGALGLLVRGRRPARKSSAPRPAASEGTARATGKICPTCGARYEGDRRYCPRDETELATLN